MRDITVDSVNFTTSSGEIATIKEMREFETMTGQAKYKTRKGQTLDEIAVEVYGDDTEFQCYKIFDHNVEAIVDSGFDLDKIKELEIPN